MASPSATAASIGNTTVDKPTITCSSHTTDTWMATGDWRLAEVAHAMLPELAADTRLKSLDATQIGHLDTSGAWLLLDWAQQRGLNSLQVQVRAEHAALIETVANALASPEPLPRRSASGIAQFLNHIGLATVTVIQNLAGLTGFLGLVLARLLASLRRPNRLPMTSTVHHIEQTGLDALPLVALLSFLVGAVIAFLGARVLTEFGAELFVIELVAYAFLREFGVLLTAILLAGRTASAFASQIGTMKGREEIDAMRTLGLDPIQLLVVPRLLALLIALPLLAFVATLAGLGGGMAVVLLSLDIPFHLFLERLHGAVSLEHYLVGLSKAPLFAVVIALVGCREGFQVTGTAQSVGERTTAAVVQSIALVILINALAAIFFMEIGV